MNYIELIGKGPVFPIQLSESGDGTTYWGTLEGDMDILISDLYGLLAHEFGQMIRQENNGHRLLELIEEPSSEVVLHLAKRFCIDYINANELRIKPLEFNDITIKRTPNYGINIEINAKLRNGESIKPIIINIE